MAKAYQKACHASGQTQDEISARIIIARIYLHIGQFKDALFKILFIIDKCEESNFEKQLVEAKLILSEIHLSMGCPYEALTQLNDIEDEILGNGETDGCLVDF